MKRLFMPLSIFLLTCFIAFSASATTTYTITYLLSIKDGKNQVGEYISAIEEQYSSSNHSTCREYISEKKTTETAIKFNVSKVCTGYESSVLLNSVAYDAKSLQAKVYVKYSKLLSMKEVQGVQIPDVFKTKFENTQLLKAGEETLIGEFEGVKLFMTILDIKKYDFE